MCIRDRYAHVISPCRSNTPPPWLLSVAPKPLLKLPPLQLTVPALLIVRCAKVLSLLPLIDSVAPFGITVAPLPFMLPPVHISAPLTVRIPLPPRLPPFKVPLTVLAGPLKLAVPPLITVLLTL